jgi:predicted transcriptional regulator
MTHPLDGLGRRERQIMEVVLSRGRASAGDVRTALPDPPSDSAVRGMLRLLEAKGHLRHRKQGRRFIYIPVEDPEEIARRAFRHVVETFFDNSLSAAFATMVGAEDDLPEEEWLRLERLVEEARAKDSLR